MFALQLLSPAPSLTGVSTLVRLTATLTRAFLRKKNASAMPPRDALPEQSAGNVSVYQDAVPSVANGQPAEAAPATTTQAAKGEAGSDDEDVFVDAETDNEDDKA